MNNMTLSKLNDELTILSKLALSKGWDNLSESAGEGNLVFEKNEEVNHLIERTRWKLVSITSYFEFKDNQAKLNISYAFNSNDHSLVGVNLPWKDYNFEEIEKILLQ